MHSLTNKVLKGNISWFKKKKKRIAENTQLNLCLDFYSATTPI